MNAQQTETAALRTEFAALRTEARALVGARFEAMLTEAVADITNDGEGFDSDEAPTKGEIYVKAARLVLTRAQRAATRTAKRSPAPHVVQGNWINGMASRRLAEAAGLI